MTTPEERTRAVLEAREFFHDLARPQVTPGVPEEVRRQARWFLRHYPSASELSLMHQALPRWFGSPAETSGFAPSALRGSQSRRQTNDTANLTDSLGWTGGENDAPFAPLTLAPGPVLLFQPTPASGNVARGPGVDVTSMAVQFLFEQVALGEGVTLADVFGLLERCPALRQVFRREAAEKLSAKARQGPLPADIGGAVDEQARLEYLELSWDWGMSTRTGRFSSVHQLDLEGVGPVLQEDAPTLRRRKGESVRWSVSSMPLRELLALPLRFNEVLTVSEDNIDARTYGDVLGRGLCCEVTLGHVIQSVLSELDPSNGSGLHPAAQTELAPSSTATTPPSTGSFALAELAGDSTANDSELPEDWTAEQLHDYNMMHGVGVATWAIRKGLFVTVGSLRELLDHFNPDMPVVIWSGAFLHSMISTDVRVMRYRETGEQESLLICTLEPDEEVAPDIECAPWETHAHSTSLSKHRRPGNRKRGPRVV